MELCVLVFSVQVLQAEDGAVTVVMPKVQKQERGPNNCAFFCAAYMVDVIVGQSVAIYIDSQIQRDWFCDYLLKGTVVQCTRLTQRRSRFQEINPSSRKFTCTA